MMNFLRKTTEEILTALDTQKIPYTYKPETELFTGTICIGHQWGAHWEIDLMDGIADEIEYVDYE